MPADIIGTNVVNMATGDVPVAQGTGVHRPAARRRNQPDAAAHAGRAARVHGGAAGDDRRRRATISRRSSPCSRRRIPIEFEGTYPLPEAQLDRFLVKIRVPYPERPRKRRSCSPTCSADSTRTISMRSDSQPIDAGSAAAARTRSRAVNVQESLFGYIAALVRQTREWPALSLGASPRAAVSLMRFAKAHRRHRRPRLRHSRRREAGGAAGAAPSRDRQARSRSRRHDGRPGSSGRHPRGRGPASERRRAGWSRPPSRRAAARSKRLGVAFGPRVLRPARRRSGVARARRSSTPLRRMPWSRGTRSCCRVAGRSLALPAPAALAVRRIWLAPLGAVGHVAACNSRRQRLDAHDLRARDLDAVPQSLRADAAGAGVTIAPRGEAEADTTIHPRSAARRRSATSTSAIRVRSDRRALGARRSAQTIVTYPEPRRSAAASRSISFAAVRSNRRSARRDVRGAAARSKACANIATATSSANLLDGQRASRQARHAPVRDRAEPDRSGSCSTPAG